MNANALLEYTSKCGCWFRAVANYGSNLSVEQVRDLLAPPLDSDKVCTTRMVQYLAFNSETATLEGILYPEHVVAGLELLKANCRSLAFHSCNA